ncbi:Usher syndrome type-1G protein homolog [Acyrthosiphon pisum]|uniref:SAM domain-containing protein n=1 Tax=Acyrthosiphon pisum TaxID=7029 RepID=A0A8R1W4S0_ACYPI|nr:Usher syndrome type-1G protein homolog [Acyrthosiphon pisum]|eukprot:XP_003243130.1 PREDICTED: Usher syndrome type-1G protein homolog [Acyrthosiphon pisum]
MSTRFHKAAQDGFVNLLKEATKRDCNAKDDDGMTPTLWAAFKGHLEALRVLVGRGGDPEKCNYHLGQNALHLAASKGHLSCVTFLVGFDVNLWALDLDFLTAMQLAAIHGKSQVLQYLDKAAASQIMQNKKKVESKKEKAQKDAERNQKKYEDRTKKEREKEKKQIRRVEKEYLGGNKADSETAIPTVRPIPLSLRKSSSDLSCKSFTEIVGSGTVKKPFVSSGGVKKILDRKLKAAAAAVDAHNKANKSSYKSIKEVEDSTSVRTITSNGDSQIIYVNSYENENGGKRGRISDVFELHRTISQPNFIMDLQNDDKVHWHDQGSMFDRPGFGSVAFRQNVTTIPVPDVSRATIEDEACSIGSAGSLLKRNQPSSTMSWDEFQNSDEENIALNGRSTKWSAVHKFLVSAGVGEYVNKFVEQRVDLDALFMLDDRDLISLGLPLGPRKKLLGAIDERVGRRCARGNIDVCPDAMAPAKSLNGC